jgi:hypothetical protein
MSIPLFRRFVAMATLAAMTLLAGCTDTNVVGKYRDTDGNKLELKSGGAALIDVGQLRIEATYTASGGKVIVKPQGGPSPDNLTLTVESDGSLVPQANPVFTKFAKVQ